MFKRNPRKAKLARVHRDRMRPLRVIEYLDNSAIFDESPVEIKEGYIISDRDTADLFLTMNLRSVSEKTIAALDIRIILYKERTILPDKKIDFRYSWEEATFGDRVLNGIPRKERECKKDKTIVLGEEFGEGIFIPLPESYFKKMQIELVSVTFFDGSTKELNLIAGGRALRFVELDGDLRDAYRSLNIFQKAEESHPIRVLPQAGNSVWLCCCGRKNPLGASMCDVCGRDKDWQFENLSVERLEETIAKNNEGKRILNDTSAYKQNKYMETEEEQKRKVELCNQALERLAVIEKQRERRQVMLLPKILLWVGIFALLYFLCELFLSFLQNYGYINQEAAMIFKLLQ
ncbi:MAG: hypothetical protein J6S15_04585 [Clostridia bacterium]|jgi:hypothetical protein|nr:hypothetical protein [Clostridia bacterium]MBO7158045.1 hypothetical protein [Clostridia bacterium]MBQ1255448.1 hypothetical protein [Clostridia bacterium]MBQ2254309.1 hypothetical protein [Clostridia bacterium]